MHPRHHARAQPRKPAVLMSDGQGVLSFADMAARANRLARLLRGLGLVTGDGIAILLDNRVTFFEPVWASLDSGLYLTTLSTWLTPPELAHILNDSDAKVLFSARCFAGLITALRPLVPNVQHVILVDDDGPHGYEALIAAQQAEPLADEQQGGFMLYSAGTTGVPKGIRPPLPGLPPGTPSGVVATLVSAYGLDQDTVYLSTAPLYHTAPLKWTIAVQSGGGTCVVMPRFDARNMLAAIEHHRITHVQCVPTMFVRLLQLPLPVREQHDLSSLRCVVHAAAACPIEIKQRMIDWLGPIIEEYYAGTESNGMCTISTAEWLQRPGSVGRSVRGTVHVMDADGQAELPTGQTGLIYFAGGTPFVYHRDPARTAQAVNSRGWSTIGDIGRVDDQGYVYLTDRRDDVIISGGVNIYPREAENLLLSHPKVGDAAVLGVPDPEFGESVKAMIQPAPGVVASLALEQELRAFLSGRLSAIKQPRTYDFVDSLPRLPTGKLLKRVLRSNQEHPE